MSVDLVLEIYQTVRTARHVKDEANGPPSFPRRKSGIWEDSRAG